MQAFSGRASALATLLLHFITVATSTTNTSHSGIRVALFVLVQYKGCVIPAWGSYSLRSWISNSAVAKFFLIADCLNVTPLEPWFSDSGAFELVTGTGTIDSILEYSQLPHIDKNVRHFGHALSSTRPLLGGWAVKQRGINLARFSHWGTIELDVVLGDLSFFLTERVAHSDVIAIRAFINCGKGRRRCGGKDLDYSYNTFTFHNAIGPNLIMYLNNEAMLRAGLQTELALREHQSNAGPHIVDMQFRNTIESAFLTGSRPWNFFEEFAWPVVLKNVGHSAFGVRSISHLCCQARGALPGCLIIWGHGEILRLCRSNTALAALEPENLQSRPVACGAKLHNCTDWGLDSEWVPNGDSCDPNGNRQIKTRISKSSHLRARLGGNATEARLASSNSTPLPIHLPDLLHVEPCGLLRPVRQSPEALDNLPKTRPFVVQSISYHANNKAKYKAKKLISANFSGCFQLEPTFGAPVPHAICDALNRRRSPASPSADVQADAQREILAELRKADAAREESSQRAPPFHAV
jgi:hypothetical protein